MSYVKTREERRDDGRFAELSAKLPKSDLPELRSKGQPGLEIIAGYERRGMVMSDDEQAEYDAILDRADRRAMADKRSISEIFSAADEQRMKDLFAKRDDGPSLTTGEERELDGLVEAWEQANFVAALRVSTKAGINLSAERAARRT
jgi:hypothetical protein